MVHRLSQILTDFLVYKKVIEEEDADIYIYGYETALSGIVDFILVIFLGSVFHQLVQAITFFIVFVSTRLYTGGFHAKTYLMCKLVFITIFIHVIWLTHTIKLSVIACVIVLLLFIFTVLKFAPVENIKKPLEVMEKKKYRWISIILSVFWSIACFVLYFFNIELSLTIIFTVISITVLMIIGVLRERREGL